MKTIARNLCLLLLPFLACRPYLDMKKEVLAIETAIGSLTQAVEDADEHLLAMAFAHDANMVCIGVNASEYLLGWDAVREHILQRRRSVDALEILSRSMDMKLYEKGNLAWASAHIDADVLRDKERKRIQGLRFTAVLEKRVGRWMIVQAHLSAPQFTSIPTDI